MKTVKFKTDEDWLQARKGKITGSTLKDIIVKRGTTKKDGYYKLIADRLSVETETEDPMERGHRLEPEAVARFTEETGIKVNTDLVMWQRDDNEHIALSPDGFIDKEQAVEVKCLASHKHVKAYLEQKIPKEYEEQAIQYFIVNDDLWILYFCFYDPRLPSLDFFYLTLKREDYAVQIDEYLSAQKEFLQEIEEIVNDITF